MRHAGCGGESERVAGVDGVRFCARAGRELVAADCGGRHVGDGAWGAGVSMGAEEEFGGGGGMHGCGSECTVGLVVGRLPDILPVARAFAADDELGEGVVRGAAAGQRDEGEDQRLHGRAEAVVCLAA